MLFPCDPTELIRTNSELFSVSDLCIVFHDKTDVLDTKQYLSAVTNYNIEGKSCYENSMYM